MANQLTAGTANSDADSMATAIANAMKEEWHLAYHTELPDAGNLDRKILFAAVAKGVLRYLYNHQPDLVTNVVNDTVSGHFHQLAFDLSDKSES